MAQQLVALELMALSLVALELVALQLVALELVALHLVALELVALELVGLQLDALHFCHSTFNHSSWLPWCARLTCVCPEVGLEVAGLAVHLVAARVAAPVALGPAGVCVGGGEAGDNKYK